MNIYKILNDITLYIDNHIEEKIDYNVLSKMMGVNNYTMQRIFSVLANIPLGEYIRKRKLSNAAYDLLTGKYKIIDIAMKYGYENATSFSRAFESFHNIKPSEIKNEIVIKELPRLVFDENIKIKSEIEYSIVNLKKLTLYGKGITTNNKNIKKDAPKFFKEIEEQNLTKYGPIKYGMVSYTNIERTICNKYSVLYDKEISSYSLIEIPESKWLKFTIPSQDSKDIQEMSQKFYKEFFPCCKYQLKDIPELEYYHDDITDFYIAIY